MRRRRQKLQRGFRQFSVFLVLEIVNIITYTVNIFTTSTAMETTSSSPFFPHQKSLEETLNNLFPEAKEETKLQKARQILGNSVSEIPDTQLAVFLTELQFLLDDWFDGYEKQLFEGKTLRQVIGN